MGAVKLSESVIPRDDLIQELLTRLAARADMRLPVHIAPYEGGEEVLINMDEEKQILTDSGPIEWTCLQGVRPGSETSENIQHF